MSVSPVSVSPRRFGASGYEYATERTAAQQRRGPEPKAHLPAPAVDPRALRQRTQAVVLGPSQAATSQPLRAPDDGHLIAQPHIGPRDWARIDACRRLQYRAWWVVALAPTAIFLGATLTVSLGVGAVPMSWLVLAFSLLTWGLGACILHIDPHHNVVRPRYAVGDGDAIVRWSTSPATAPTAAWTLAQVLAQTAHRPAHIAPRPAPSCGPHMDGGADRSPAAWPRPRMVSPPGLRAPLESPFARAQRGQEVVATTEASQRGAASYVCIAPFAPTGPAGIDPGPWRWKGWMHDSLEFLFFIVRGLGARVEAFNASVAQMFVGIFMDGFAGIALDTHVACGPHHTLIGPSLGMWLGRGTTGGELGYAYAPLKAGARYNFTAARSSQQTLDCTEHLGQSTSSSDAAAVRDHLGLGPDSCVVRVDTTSTHERSLVAPVACGLGVGLGLVLRLLRRTEDTHTCDISYSTWVGASAAAYLQHLESGGVWAKLRRRVGPRRVEVGLVPPNPARPEDLVPGDVLCAQRGRRSSLMYALGVQLGLYGGDHGAQLEQEVLQLERHVPDIALAGPHPPWHALKVALTTRYVNAGRRFFSTLGGLNWDAGTLTPKARASSVTLPMKPANMAHYRTFYATLADCQSDEARHRAIAALAAACGQTLDEEVSKERVTSKDLGVRVTLAPSFWWIQRAAANFCWGLADHERTVSVKRSGTWNDNGWPRAWVEGTLSLETRRLRGPLGESGHCAKAIAWRGGGTPPRIVLFGRMQNSRADGKVMAEMAAPLFAACVGPGAHAPAGTAPTIGDAAAYDALRGSGWHSRSITIGLELTPDDLRALARLKPEEACSAGAPAGVSAQKLRKLSQALSGAADEANDERLVAALEQQLSQFLADTKTSGLGAISRAVAMAQGRAADGGDIWVLPDCPNHDRPQRLADQLEAACAVTPWPIFRRRLAAAQRETEECRYQISWDPWLHPALRQHKLSACDKANLRLDALAMQPHQPWLNPSQAACAWFLAGENMLRGGSDDAGAHNGMNPDRGAARRAAAATLVRQADALAISGCPDATPRLSHLRASASEEAGCMAQASTKPLVSA